MTPEQNAEVHAILDAILGPKPLPKPKLVVHDDSVVGDANVHVSPADVNASAGRDEVVSVRRPCTVTIDINAYARQQAEKEAERERRKLADPYNLGLYGPLDES